jgi:hypothetical protein
MVDLTKLPKDTRHGAQPWPPQPLTLYKHVGDAEFWPPEKHAGRSNNAVEVEPLRHGFWRQISS